MSSEPKHAGKEEETSGRKLQLQHTWLSIIIPAYNSEAYLGECIESIKPELHPDVGIVVIDDGSSDGTPRLCDALSVKHENLLAVHTDNHGAAAARNVGVAIADDKFHSQWVWFVDSDDVISPFALAFLKPLASSTDADMVQMKFNEFSDGKEPAWPAPVPSENAGSISSYEFLSGLYRGQYCHYMWSFLLRAEMLCSRNDHMSARSRNEHRAVLPEDYSLYEDVVAVERLAREAKTVAIADQPLYGYRQLNTSVSHKHSDSAADSGLRAVLEIADYDTPKQLKADKTRMEMSLLFTAYRIAGIKGVHAHDLKQRIREEIETRANSIGIWSLGPSRLARYAALETGLMDKIIAWRERD